MFKPDTWGSTYMFTDIDYKSDGVMGAYWEISRDLILRRISSGLHMLSMTVV